MIAEFLKEAFDQDWFSKNYTMPSSLIESYLLGFEDSFGSFEHVLIKV